MKKLYVILLSLAFCACIFAQNSIQVVVDYGAEKQAKTAIVAWQQGITALEALESAFIVETHFVGGHLLVAAIDSVKNIRGQLAWYYKVNGRPATVLAANNFLSPGDSLLWAYKTDVCSALVDKTK